MSYIKQIVKPGKKKHGKTCDRGVVSKGKEAVVEVVVRKDKKPHARQHTHPQADKECSAKGACECF